MRRSAAFQDHIVDAEIKLSPYTTQIQSSVAQRRLLAEADYLDTLIGRNQMVHNNKTGLNLQLRN